MFNPKVFQNSRPDGFPVLEVPGADGERTGFVPLRRTHLAGELAGPLAALTLTQTFAYSAEQCDRTLEALYRFPLPGDVAVTGVRIRFGETEIEAGLKERGQAEAEYEQAKAEGRQAALTTRESPDVFTLQVAGLQPNQEVEVTTRYVQLARPEGAGWSLRVPLTTAPRYVRGDERDSRAAAGQPLALLRDPGHCFSLEVTVARARTVTSRTHALEVRPGDEGLEVRLVDGEVLPDRDLLLAWEPLREVERPAVSVLLHRDPGSEWLYFLALVAPPARPARRVPREAVLLVDHSGSMSGAKWEAADWAVKQFLSGLEPQDQFDLGLFHDRTRWLSKRPEAGNPARVDAAVRFLEKHRDSGGTELGVALEQALGMARAPGTPSRHVLVITDAEVTDAARILRLADTEAELADRRRISVLCIDAAPNAFLAQELADRGGGTAHFLTSDPDEGDITTALEEVLADWDAPVYAGLRLDVNRPTCDAGGRGVRARPEAGGCAVDLGDLPAGRSVWVAGRVPHDGSDLSFRLAGSEGPVAACRLPVTDATADRAALKALFGARRVLALEHLRGAYDLDEVRDQLQRLGFDPAELLPAGSGRTVYAENRTEESSAALKSLLVREALEFGLASSETAFVATRKEASRPVEGTVVVANALPSGWDEDFETTGAFYLAAPAAGAGAPRLRSLHVAAASAPPPPSVAMAQAPFPTVKRKMAESAGARRASSAQVFSGVPVFARNEAVLFDSDQQPDLLPNQGTLSRIRLRVNGKVDPAAVDPDLELWLFVDDLAAPRARVRVADLLRAGGERPLNLRRPTGAVVRIVLVDPNGAWQDGAPELEVELGW